METQLTSAEIKEKLQLLPDFNEVKSFVVMKVFVPNFKNTPKIQVALLY